MKKNHLFYLLGLSVFTAYSCEDHYGICNVPRAVYAQGNFYRINGGTEIATPASSLTISYLNSSSTIYNNAPNQNDFKVLLSPAEDTMHYFIRLDGLSQGDTISMVYSTLPYAISEECGTISVYTLSNVFSTGNTIDSMSIISNAVNNTSGQNLKIYF